MDDIKKYQSMIGALQWVVTIEGLMSQRQLCESCFRVAPRQGHLDRLKRIYGYLAKMKHAALRVRLGSLIIPTLKDREYDARSVYGNANRVNPRRTAKTTRLQQRQWMQPDA
jgi:hypothetical protein